MVCKQGTSEMCALNNLQQLGQNVQLRLQNNIEILQLSTSSLYLPLEWMRVKFKYADRRNI